ncbi:MAG: hypothetical protein ABSC91_11090 [Candidatus Bathyarchaeia archaeon]
MGKRRTHPSYLSNDEAARERERTKEMVRSIVGISHSGSSVERKQTVGPVKSKGITRVGETDNFIVDFDGEKKLVIVYGREVQAECRFKLAFDKDELIQMVDLLKKTYDFFQ